MAQTRPKPNPRPLRVRNQFRPELALITNVSFASATSLEVQLVREGLFGPAQLPKYKLIGADTIERFPTGAAIDADGSLITLTFASLIPQQYTLDVQAWDEAFRTPTGGYVAPFSGTVELV